MDGWRRRSPISNIEQGMINVQREDGFGLEISGCDGRHLRNLRNLRMEGRGWLDGWMGGWAEDGVGCWVVGVGGGEEREGGLICVHRRSSAVV